MTQYTKADIARILRETKLPQTGGVLCEVSPEGERCYCALGVLLKDFMEKNPGVVEERELGHGFRSVRYFYTDEFGIERRFTHALPPELARAMGLSFSLCDFVVNKNDSSMSFAEIAEELDSTEATLKLGEERGRA